MWVFYRARGGCHNAGQQLDKREVMPAHERGYGVFGDLDSKNESISWLADTDWPVAAVRAWKQMGQGSETAHMSAA
jgi:hypothetical protein